MAICNHSPHSPYIGWYFPRNWMELFHKYTLFDTITNEERQGWEDAYTTTLKKASYAAKGHRLILKNPCNTARIPQLLELYPDAKFIHIHRNPYEVYKSTIKLHHTVIRQIGLHTLTDDEIKNNVVQTYPLLMQRFIDTRDQIPPENFIEIPYEELDDAPLPTMEKIYSHLNLPDWTPAHDAMNTYLHQQGTFTKNQFAMDPEDIAIVQKHWAIGLDTWGYSAPEAAE